MKTQHQYAAETHPDLGDGKAPTWGEHMAPLQTKVVFGFKYHNEGK